MGNLAEGDNDEDEEDGEVQQGNSTTQGRAEASSAQAPSAFDELMGATYRRAALHDYDFTGLFLMRVWLSPSKTS